jgi:hypothetical protein
MDPGTRHFDPLEQAVLRHGDQVRQYVRASQAVAPELSALHHAELRERGALPEQRQLTFEILFAVVAVLLGVAICAWASIAWG